MEPNISTENSNSFHWKNKLEDVSALSAEVLKDKNASWEKLHNRLRQKPRRIRAIWYWAAAACVILLLIIPMLITNKKQNDLVKNDSKINHNEKPGKGKILPSNENVITFSAPSLPLKKKVVKEPFIINLKRNHFNNNIKNENPYPANFTAAQSITPQLIVPITVSSNSLKPSLALAPAKIKLKVVHINELGEPLEESAIAKYNERRSFKLKLINPQVYSTLPLSLNNTGFTFFKSKNIPSN